MVSGSFRHSALALAGIAFCLLGCSIGCGSRSGTLSTIPAIPTSRELNQARWISRDIKSYRYTFQLHAFVAPPATAKVQIEVRNGSTVSVSSIDPKIDIDPTTWSAYNSIDKLFAIIARAEAQKAVQIDTTYASGTGIPTTVYIDYDRRIADEELGFTVTDFEAL